MKLLGIGTELYFLEESFTDRWFSNDPYHFEIVHGKISRINRGGYNEYVVLTYNRYGRKSNLKFAKTTNLGKSFWLTYQEAVEAAERESDRYEARWGRYHKEPLMRPWRTEKEKQS